LAYQNQVLLPAVGPLWDPLSTGMQPRGRRRAASSQHVFIVLASQRRVWDL
jgi:hypothetical protein